MPGPCSMPAGNKAEWDRHNSTVCNLHSNSNFECTPDHRKMGRNSGGQIEIAHEWVTLRVWLSLRNKLRTGKTR
jgi:hypothetical protein